jgi:hypothetical protein
LWLLIGAHFEKETSKIQFALFFILFHRLVGGKPVYSVVDVKGIPQTSN